MDIVHNPHDTFFKTSLSNLKVARSFFEGHLPSSIQQYLDFNSLELQPGNYIDQVLKNTASDILYKVQYAKHAGSVYLYILAEHQSRVDTYMSFRLLDYMVSIWADHRKNYKTKKLPLIIPLVFYNGLQKYNGPKDMRELIEAPQHLIELFLFKPFHLIDTHDISDEELCERHWSGLMEYLMKHVYEREKMKHVCALELENYLEYLITFLKPIYQDGGSHYGTSALYYFLTQVNSEEPNQILEMLKQGLDEEEKIMATTAAEYLRQEGRQEGMQQGIQQTAIKVLLGLLETKFKKIPEFYKKKIMSANSKKLLQWAARVLECETLDSVFSD
jgi:predicted transposase/invertase (TIGR01784 family)